MEYFTFPITQRPPPRSGQRFSWNSDDNDEAARIRDRLVFWGVTTHKWFTYIVRALFYSHPVSTYSTIVDHKRNYYLFIQNCILNGIYFVNIWSGRRMDGGSADCKMNIISCTLCKWLPFQVQRSRGGVLGAEWKGGEYIEQSSRKESGAGIATHEFVFLRFCWFSMCGRPSGTANQETVIILNIQTYIFHYFYQ